MYVSIDVGGTKINISIFEKLSTESEVESFRIKTSGEFDKDISNIIESLSKYTNQIKEVSIALPGFRIDKSKGIISAAYLPKWENKNLYQKLKNGLASKKVHILHDGEAHAISEYSWGHIDKSFIFIAWGTGIGSTFVRIIGNKTYTQQIEFGFQYVRGQTLESLVGGKILKERFGKSPANLKQKHWDDIIDDFGEGLANILALNYCDEIIWGGGIAIKNSAITNKIIDSAHEKYPYWDKPKSRLATYKEKGAIYGGLGLIKIKE
jgi:predicted NBD/HSP70 family sugar kinase